MPESTFGSRYLMRHSLRGPSLLTKIDSETLQINNVLCLSPMNTSNKVFTISSYLVGTFNRFYTFLSNERSETLLWRSNSGGVVAGVVGVKLLLISHFYWLLLIFYCFISSIIPSLGILYHFKQNKLRIYWFLACFLQFLDLENFQPKKFFLYFSI